MAAEYNITVHINADLQRSFQLKEDGVIVDLTNYSVAGALKENFRATTSIPFQANITSAVGGLFDIALTDVTTSAMDPGTWVYDIVLTNPSGAKTRLMQGNAFVLQGVTS